MGNGADKDSMAATSKAALVVTGEANLTEASFGSDFVNLTFDTMAEA